MEKNRINGTVTYIGTREEITALLREHAEARNAAADYFTAAALTQAADGIESGACHCYRSMVAYLISDAVTDQEQLSREPVGQQRGT